MLFSFLSSVTSSESEKEFKKNLQILVLQDIDYGLNHCLNRLGYGSIKEKVIDESTNPGNLYKDLRGIEVYILLPPPPETENEVAYSKCTMSFLNILKADNNNLKLVIHSNLTSSSSDNATQCVDILEDRKAENKWIVEEISVQNEKLDSTLEDLLKKGMHTLLARVTSYTFEVMYTYYVPNYTM